jgi:aarF domain-containing kinase
MELCTASVSTSAHRSHISTFNRPLPYHQYASSRSWVSKRRRQSSLYVMNAASTRVLPSSRGIGKPAQTNGAAVSNQKNSALEQLDIERGVCIPFRKYSPEMVWSTTSISVCKIWFAEVCCNYFPFHNC